MAKRMVIGSGWKMNKTRPEARAFMEELRSLVPQLNTALLRPYVLPSFTLLDTVECVRGDYPIEIGAQDMFWEEAGPYTGEISPLMLRDVGCSIVMLGHSERRAMFGETDEALRRKVAAALDHGLAPMLCIGETREERDREETVPVLRRQLGEALADVPAARVDDVLFLYEPRWAIGQPEPAPLDVIETTHRQLRQVVAEGYGEEIAQRATVVYGGSVNVNNLESILRLPGIDGCGASRAAWSAANFARMIQIAGQVAAEKAS